MAATFQMSLLFVFVLTFATCYPLGSRPTNFRVVLVHKTSSSTLDFSGAGSTFFFNGENIIMRFPTFEFCCTIGAISLAAEVALCCSECCLLDVVSQTCRGQIYVFTSEIFAKKAPF